MQNFNLHQHTYRCGHAEMDATDEDYIKDYLKIGIKKVAFTDHAPEKNPIDKRPKIRMDYSDRLEYLDSIKILKEKYKNKIDILSGYEIEYLPGEEENLKELKNETDILILGQHFVYADNNKDLNIIGWGHSNSDDDIIKYGEYIKSAIEEGLTDIIAHPDLFMLGRKSFENLEEEVTRNICVSAEKYNIPLEINLNNIFVNTFYNIKTEELSNDSIEKHYSKLNIVSYPCKSFWKIVSEYNIKVLYGLDTHRRAAITYFEDLIKFANYIMGDEIINKLQFIDNV